MALDPIDEPVVPRKGEGRDVHETAQLLTDHIQEGKHNLPDVPTPLVCKPTNTLESWRVFKIMSEFVEGFDLLSKYGLAASFFGSTRTDPEDPFYKQAQTLAGRLAKAGFSIITGGSTGIMQAANQGAFEAGGSSVGLNIRLGTDQGMNRFLTDYVKFDHFFVRKVMLTFSSEVYIYFPGGFGTLDEFFEILTLVQTKKIKQIPIVLYGKEYWEPLLEFFDQKMLKDHVMIDVVDKDLYKLVDTVDEAYQYIIANAKC